MKKRFTTERITRKPGEAEGKRASGRGVPEVCRELGMGESSYPRWKTQHGGIERTPGSRRSQPSGP